MRAHVHVQLSSWPCIESTPGCIQQLVENRWSVHLLLLSGTHRLSSPICKGGRRNHSHRRSFGPSHLCSSLWQCVTKDASTLCRRRKDLPNLLCMLDACDLAIFLGLKWPGSNMLMKLAKSGIPLKVLVFALEIIRWQVMYNHTWKGSEDGDSARRWLRMQILICSVRNKALLSSSLIPMYAFGNFESSW